MPSHAPRHAAAAPRFYISKTAIYYFYIIYMQVRGVAWRGVARADAARRAARFIQDLQLRSDHNQF